MGSFPMQALPVSAYKCCINLMQTCSPGSSSPENSLNQFFLFLSLGLLGFRVPVAPVDQFFGPPLPICRVYWLIMLVNSDVI